MHTVHDTPASTRTQCRYVTRAGQGGRQSTKGNTGKSIKSMGSQLRRANEAALERDIAATLAAWHCDLAKCDLIFVHAPAANARAVFSCDAVERGDTRVRRIPFTTARPTLKELKRVLAQLASIEEVAAPALPNASAAGASAAERKKDVKQVSCEERPRRGASATLRVVVHDVLDMGCVIGLHKVLACCRNQHSPRRQGQATSSQQR